MINDKFSEIRSIMLELEGLDMRIDVHKPIAGKTIMRIWHNTKNYLDNQDAPDEQLEFDIYVHDDIEKLAADLFELWWRKRAA